MTKYRRKDEIEAEQWDDFAGNPAKWHQNIVQWIKDNGGEARYEPEGERAGLKHMTPEVWPARIVITTSTGSVAASHRFYIIKGGLFNVASADADESIYRTEFYVREPEGFEREWERQDRRRERET